jgi:parallel beta-helix repeat protein
MQNSNLTIVNLVKSGFFQGLTSGNTKIFLTLFVFAAFSFFNPAFGKVWRINNNTGVDADFDGSSFAIVMSAVSNGDTLLFEPSLSSYGSWTFTKQLQIYGAGFYLGENDSTQAKTVTSKINEVIFNSGSHGSKFSGFGIDNDIEINTHSIIVERCSVNVILLSNADNSIIRQNWIHNSSCSREAIHFLVSSNNVYIYNNIISSNCEDAIYMHNDDDAVIYNNILLSAVVLHNSVVRNNIVKTTYGFTLGNCNYSNNISAGSQFGTSSGNQANIPMQLVFVDYDGSLGHSTDEKWKLKTNSPAIGAGHDGRDCGMFGGPEPYVLSGMPEIPAIFYFDSPLSGSTQGGLNVHVKVMSHK